LSEKNVLTKAPDEAAFTEKKVDVPAKVSDAWKLVKEAIADMKKGS
jgi:hypothetical protein